MSDRLLELLKEKSYMKKKVILASGRESDFYIDVRQTALHPEGMVLIGRKIFNLVSGQVKAVGGITSGADPLVCAVAVVSFLEKNPLMAFFIRKELKKHGTSQWIEGAKNLTPGMPVAILEDVVTTGASTLFAIEKAKEFGCDVKRVICVVDREEGGAEEIQKNGYRLESLYKKTDFI